MREYATAVVSPAYRVSMKVTGIKCDVCGKVTPAKQGRFKETEYYEVTTGHHDWGNDSCDSIETRDVCPACVGQFATEYLLKDTYGSTYLEVERKYCWPEEDFTFMKTPPKGD